MSASAAAPNSGGNELRITFLNGSSAPFESHELVAMVFRRKTLWVAGYLTLMLSAISFGPMRAGLPLWIHPVVTLANFLLFSTIFFGLLLLVETLARLNGWRRVFEPVLTLIAAIMVSLASYGLKMVIVDVPRPERAAILLDLAMKALFWEGLVSLYFLYIVPGERTWAEARPAPQARPPQPLRFGRLEIDPDSVTRIDSKGHYLTLHHATGQDRVLAPLSDTAAKLSAQGMVVHRSHWIAYREMVAMSRDRRSLILTTRSSGPVPVSREKAAEVRRRLKSGESLQ